jgi:mRNA interferase MazF
MMIENLDKWNGVKKQLSKKEKLISFKDRDIFYMNMGENLGFEQNGKGESFVRPVIIFKKFNKSMFLGIPISSQVKEGSYFFKFEFEKRSKQGSKISKNIAILVQLRLYSSKRLLNKIGVINKESFEKMSDDLKKLVF